MQLRTEDSRGNSLPASCVLLPRALAKTFLVFLSASPAFAAGPRDPLTFRNSGLYGPSSLSGTADPYFTNPNKPFDFFVLQAPVYEGQAVPAAFLTELGKYRQYGRRVILDFIPQIRDGTGDWYGVANNSGTLTDAQMERLANVATQFFATVNQNDIYGMSIGEEHVFWNGQDQILNTMYDKLKLRTNVPIFQWFTPASQGTAPGLNGFPNLKSDGWVSDEYVLDQPDMERNMRQYTVLQKPIVNTIWAGAHHPSIPFIDARFNAQVAVHQKYNIPMNFFDFSSIPGGGTGHSNYPYGPDMVLAAEFQKVLDAVNAAKTSPDPNLSSWDTVPWSIPTISLPYKSGSTRRASYAENYVSDRIVRFVNDAQITGFANLRWDSTPVQLRPRQTGPAQSTVTYKFQSPGPLAYLNVIVPASVTAGSNGAVSMSIYNSNGSLLQTTNLTGSGPMKIGISGDQFTGRNFQVAYTMTGSAVAVGDVLAGVNSIDVNAIVGNQPLYPFTQQFDLSNSTEQSKWSVTLNTSAGPKGPQFNPATIHYNSSTNTYEPLATSEVRIQPINSTTNGTGDITLIRKFDAPGGTIITSPVFEADAFGYSSWGTLTQLWLSKDGVNWDVASQPASAGYLDQHLIADASNVVGYEDLTSVWLKVRMYDLYGFGNSNGAYVHAWNLALSGLKTIGTAYQSEWALNGSGNWNSTTSWASGIPNAVDATAKFLGVITSTQTVFTNTPVTVGGLVFDNNNTYVITGGGSLTIEKSAGTGSISVLRGHQKINLPLIFASDANVAVSSGATLTIGNPMTINAGRTVTTSGSVLVQAPLSVNAGASLVIGPGAATLFGAPSLASGAKVNVQTGTLTIDYRGLSSPASTIRTQLTSGYNGGAWNGAGINTSNSSASIGLGWIDQPGTSAIRIQRAYYGDTNLNGTVDSTDFNWFVASYGMTTGAIWAQGDFNYDGRTDTRDFNHLAGNFGQTLASAPLGAVVPEPGVAGGVSLLAILGFSRKAARRRASVRTLNRARCTRRATSACSGERSFFTSEEEMP